MESKVYEFNETQNKLIKDLADKMRFVSYFLIAWGVLLLINGILIVRYGAIGSIISGIVQILIGFWTHKAASSFRLIVDTQGRDINNLMSSLGALRKLYNLQYWLILFAAIFIAASLIIAAILGNFSIIR